MCVTYILGLLYRDEDAEILAVGVPLQEDVHGPVSLRRYGYQEMAMEVRHTDLKAAIVSICFCFVGNGYVGECQEGRAAKIRQRG